MRRRNTLLVAIAAALGALALAALPALAGAKDDHHHRRGEDRGEHRHHHGDRDRRENVGRISAFDSSTGLLTITRFGGGTISGLVTPETEIKCEGPNDNARLSRDGGSNSGPGGGRGEEEPGDDHGEGLEPGDDHGGQGEEEPGDDHGEDGVNADNSGPGSANSGPGRGDENDNDDRICTTAELTVGTVVHELDRHLVNGVASFDEIELGHTS